MSSVNRQQNMNKNLTGLMPKRIKNRGGSFLSNANMDSVKNNKNLPCSSNSTDKKKLETGDVNGFVE